MPNVRTNNKENERGDKTNTEKRNGANGLEEQVKEVSALGKEADYDAKFEQRVSIRD